MEFIIKNLSVKEANKLIFKLINESELIDIENFWFIELDECHLTIKDSKIFNRIIELKNNKTEPSISLYNNCIKGNIISNLLKKNWRRLFNNDVINKYYVYVNQT